MRISCCIAAVRFASPKFRGYSMALATVCVSQTGRTPVRASKDVALPAAAGPTVNICFNRCLLLPNTAKHNKSAFAAKKIAP
jgi:hypothetical protein